MSSLPFYMHTTPGNCRVEEHEGRGPDDEAAAGGGSRPRPPERSDRPRSVDGGRIGSAGERLQRLDGRVGEEHPAADDAAGLGF